MPAIRKENDQEYENMMEYSTTKSPQTQCTTTRNPSKIPSQNPLSNLHNSFINHNTTTFNAYKNLSPTLTSLPNPIPTQSKTILAPIIKRTGSCDDEVQKYADLPDGWTYKKTEHGEVYYLNHIEKYKILLHF